MINGLGQMNNKQPWQQQGSGMGGGFPGMGFGMSGMGGLGAMFGMGGQGLPSGYARPPAGVPFQQNPYTPFGSGFGLGLPYWASGFGRGPQFPSNLWTPPGQNDSPQSQVTPPGGGAGAGGDTSAMDLMRFNQQGILPGGQRMPFGGQVSPHQNGMFSGAPEGFRQQFQDVYGQNAVPQFAQDRRQQWLDMIG